MSRRALVPLALVLAAAPALAATAEQQDGECVFAGDWRAKATPLTTSGPPLHPNLVAGACASAYAETRAGRQAFTLRADVLDPDGGAWEARWKVGAFSGTFDCGETFCSFGPFDATSLNGRCAAMELWDGGVRVRRAAACV